MRKEKGFSMIELLIVVTIITLIAAIAIPNLRKARQSAHKASAIQSLRTITTAEHLYKTKFQQYGTLAQLAPEGTLDNSLSVGTKGSYSFAISVTTDPPSPDFVHFKVNATPFEDVTLPHFYVDETAVIRYVDGAPADATSPPIPR
jgi:prepilin-type N-terminal cleavage/methylation domain-containing protein